VARGRPRQFDEQQVLGRAAQLFRERGYASTSMQALSDAMEMGEQSIYNAFGSKEHVFQRALERYCDQGEEGLRTLAAPGASRGAIEAFFAALVDTMSGDAPACLVTQTCLTRGAAQPEVDRQISRQMRKIERYFQRAVQRAVERGEASCDDPKTAARYLNMTVQGLTVLARSGTSKKALRELVELSLQVLQ
jgi:TetR/AcrR family transcriptional regulator, transcriptional repressor for nem operon